MTSEKELLSRIEKLEGANRRTKRLLGGFGILAVAFLVMGQAGSKKTIEANEFLLKDASGNAVGRLTMRENVLPGTGPVPCLNLGGKSRVAEASLCAGDDFGAALFLTDHRSGQTQAVLSAGVHAAGQELPTGLTVGSAGGKQSILASIDKDGPTLTIVGSKTKPVWTAP
jgi:hypothetical protein